MVRSSDVIALKKICGRLFITVGSSVTFDSAEADIQPSFSSLQ